MRNAKANIKRLVLIKWTLLIVGLLAFSVSYSQTPFLVNNVDDISHFRAHRMHLEQQSLSKYLSQSVQDKSGYIWSTDGLKVYRYDGYTLTTVSSGCYSFIDSAKNDK